MTAPTYPCACFPDCGMMHAGPNGQDSWHEIDHADRYLELVAKLLDREAFVRFAGDETWDALSLIRFYLLGLDQEPTS